ncbi:hydrogenase maturation nickel metallochaperone HypA [Candidatus Pacearchaeota archaeon]|nr:hydrogenase maturation nickel metallochaperone HypA [Candidatus Pacearchaeota archaeon]
MHEINIADRVLREARGAGAKHFFRVEVGELCEITSEELEEGLKRLTEMTLSDDFNSFGNVVLQTAGNIEDLGEEKIEFKVDFKQSRVRCKCGFVGRANIVDRGHGYCVWNCPSCGLSGKNVEVLEGGEIKIVEVE